MLQLLEPVERRVFLHQLCGVEQRAGGGDLFPAGDDVGLCPLFRDQHCIHDVADLAGKNDILHARVDNFHEELVFFCLKALKGIP